jgi:N-acetylglucosaminyl-diphospho-decaprenol L-rhamnosyltransferase
MDVSIILVNWNSVDYLRECIPSLREYSQGLCYEIIVVDNASPAGDADVMEREFSDIVLIKSEENLGFAGANNLGFKRSTGKYMLFLNPDTKFISPVINIMLKRSRSLPDAGVVGCKLLNRDLSIQTSSIMQFPTIFNELFQLEYLRLRWPDFWGIGPLFSSSTEPAEAEVISGACMLIRRDVFEKVGMFSEDYFMYAEDMDLCYKIAKAGWTNYYVGEAVAVHYAGTSSPRLWQLVVKVGSTLRFCEKFYGRLYTWLFRIALACNAVARLIVIYGLSLFVKKESLQSLIVKWTTTLRTLINPSSCDEIVPSRKPVASQARA